MLVGGDRAVRRLACCVPGAAVSPAFAVAVLPSSTSDMFTCSTSRMWRKTGP